MSNSWGRYHYGTGDPYGEGALEDAIEYANENGVLFVGAVNQHGYDLDDELVYTPSFYPAAFDFANIIAVMATDNDDELAEWNGYSSNYGAFSVDLAAPGTCIWSCWPGDQYLAGYGTSMSTPHVAGACALVWAVNPSLSHLEVKGIILSTVDELESLDGLCVTSGRLNLNNAVLEAVEFPTDDELVGWWKFDEGEGTIAYDSAGDNNGDLIGDPQWVDGKIDGALDFDGDGDYVSLSPIVALLTDNVTISAWIRAVDVPEPGFIVSQFKQVGDNYYGYYFYLDDDNKLTFYLSGSWATSPDAISGGVWYHLAGTYDGSDLKIFVDGEEPETNPTSGLTGCFHNAYIGYGLQEQQYFRGKIDDVRVYNYALSKFEIWDAMSGDLPRFRVKDSSGETVAWFDSFGNLFLKGSLEQGDKNPPSIAYNDGFKFKNPSDANLAMIDGTNGNMYIYGEKKNWNTPSAGKDEFIIRNSDDDPNAYISDVGNLYLTGKLYENPD